MVLYERLRDDSVVYLHFVLFFIYILFYIDCSSGAASVSSENPGRFLQQTEWKRILLFDRAKFPNVKFPWYFRYRNLASHFCFRCFVQWLFIPFIAKKRFRVRFFLTVYKIILKSRETSKQTTFHSIWGCNSNLPFRAFF